jgi:transcriptional regulator with XRE-family HTH domain
MVDQEKLAAAMQQYPHAFAEAFLALRLKVAVGEPSRKKADDLLRLAAGTGVRRGARCGETGHNIRTCKKAQRKQYSCRKCGEPGHNAATCGRPEPTPRSRVREYREKVEAKYPGMLEMLGDSTDQVVGDEYGLSRQRIQQIRKKLGIEACQTPFLPTSEQIALLGTRTDRDLAAEWRVSSNTVSRIRRDRNISAWTPWVEYEKALEPHLDKIGKISDPKVAKIAGVTVRVVYEYRHRKGIKTSVLAPTHEDFVPHDRGEIEELFKEGWSDEEIAEIIGSTRGTVQNIRSSELGLFRAEPVRRSTTGERARVLRVWEHCGRNLSETARRTDRSVSFVREVVREALDQ